MGGANNVLYTLISSYLYTYLRKVARHDSYSGPHVKEFVYSWNSVSYNTLHSPNQLVGLPRKLLIVGFLQKCKQTTPSWKYSIISMKDYTIGKYAVRLLRALPSLRTCSWSQLHICIYRSSVHLNFTERSIGGQRVGQIWQFSDVTSMKTSV